jgi:hypothetical protein
VKFTERGACPDVGEALMTALRGVDAPLYSYAPISQAERSGRVLPSKSTELLGKDAPALMQGEID